MKNLLFQLDTDAIPSSFDAVVAYDGGADHLIQYGGMTPQNVGGVVAGTIFTRSPREKKHTAIFVGGSDMVAGQELFKAVKANFFANFRVSVMLDSNGSNTTAAAAVACIAKSLPLAGKRAVVLAGTGPVGSRAAAMLAQEGATVAITGRKLSKTQEAAAAVKARFGVDVEAIEAADNAARARALEGAHVVLACGAASAALLDEAQWKDHPTLQVLADANATPPLGITGVDMMDKGVERHGKVCWGAIGFGALKLSVHRACIGKLFESNDLVLDAEEIFALAKQMA